MMSPQSSRPAPSLGDNGLLSSVSRCRSLLPAPVSNSEGSTSGSDQGPSLPSLRPRANLTRIACESCRKRKAKDSDRDQHVLKRKYDEIQKKANTYEQLYHLLTCLPEREAQGILRRLREGADVATTTRQVKDGDLPLQPAWSPETRLHYEFPYSTSMPAALLSPDNPYLGSPVFEITSHALPQSAEQTEFPKWTSIETDDELLRALLRAYFLHDYTNYTCFQKDIFLKAMRDGDTRFCSPLLVNAVLAEACHSYRGTTHRAQFWRPETLGYRFLAEAKRLWELESGKVKLTTLHAAMVLHVIYAINGLDQVGVSYLIQSVLLAQGLKLFAPEQTEGRTRTARVFTAWALYRWQSLQAFHNFRAPLIREPPATPMPDLAEEPSWYGELWLRYPPSSILVPMHFGYVYRAQTELRRIANGIACIMFEGQKTARSLPASELARFRKVLDDWYNALPEPIKSHKAVLPCQLIMQCLETVLRLYYLRHSFEHSDTYLTYFLSILAYTTIENMNSDSVSPSDVETLKILRATLILAVKGLYDQGQHVYVSSAMCRLMRDRMTKEDMNGLRRHTTWKDDQPLVPYYVRSMFPVTIMMLDEDWQMETVKNLAKKYDRLALEANESESSMAMTPDRGSE
ncbi:hypothetical protein MRS44_013723 [Fusarium solani]|uniref:uncharacterized protein n=1 Tax=Fusarium solani TaxID=169388 RepID=UPI0032C4A3C5|nr:hypothetical protein MRS44_013723 [Fusarium solani]